MITLDFSNIGIFNMRLFLHSPNNSSEISNVYEEAFSTAKRLYVVSAYLTDWDLSLSLNQDCESFRIIVGKDFGITRKNACLKVLKWLPPERKSQFLVADEIVGFHPKAVFWMDHNNQCFALIGSSNLTKSAFESNYEANILSGVPDKDFYHIEQWVTEISKRSVVVSEDWISCYQEGNQSPKQSHGTVKNNSVISLELPLPDGALNQVLQRRKQLEKHQGFKERLHSLFRNCATSQITSSDFYEQLPDLWSAQNGNRLQGAGWERQGKSCDFQELSKSFIRILQANERQRDDVTREEMDRLCGLNVSARKAFFSEMLCLAFPFDYPVLNKPVRKYLEVIKFRPPKGASEGATYLDLAIKLRSSLKQNFEHPAKNLAELDTVIWLEYHD